MYNRLKKTKITQIKYYDAKHIFIIFHIKDKMLLNFKYIKITKSFKKLNNKYYDSFKIELFIKKQIYPCRLLKIFKTIDNVFYMSLLKLYRKNFEKQFSSIMIKEKEQSKMKFF